jgi:hypothetical protein
LSGTSHERWWARIWDRHHDKAGWVLLGVLGGVVAGMSAGSWASCAGESAGCAVHWDAVEAIGTWFGALGGLLAVGAAIATVRSSELNRQAEQRRQELTLEQRAAEARETAERVYARPRVGGTAGIERATGKDVVDQLHVGIFNDNTHATVHRMTVEIDGGINGVDAPKQNSRDLQPNSSQNVGYQFDPRRQTGIPAVALARDERQGWLDEIAPRIVLTYVIDNVTWRRVGRDTPTKIS